MLEKIGLPPKPSLRGNNWVVDASNCQGCSCQFTCINRKHHCRRCGGLFCNSCTQQRMVLRGQGDLPVRICEPCKKLEEAARFEMRYGHKNRAGRGGSKLAAKNEDEIFSQILGSEGKVSLSSKSASSVDMLAGVQQATSSALCSSFQEGSSHDGQGDILRSLSHDQSLELLSEVGTVTPEELRQQALDEKKKYRTLKGEGKPEEALRAFKRGKELERQAGALELHLRKNRKKALASSHTSEHSSTNEESKASHADNKLPSLKSKGKDDLTVELRELGWSDLDLYDANKKLPTMSLEGELSSLIGEVSQKPNVDKGIHELDKSQVIAHKKRALELKREGKLSEAKEELKKAKVLEKQIEEQELLGEDEDSDEEFSSLLRSMNADKHEDLTIGNDAVPSFDFDHLGGFDDIVGNGNLDVTEEDMDDPEIAAALQSLGWNEGTSHSEDVDSQIAPINKEALLTEIQSLKKEALHQKRAGNTGEALALLKKAKLLEKDLDSSDCQQTNLMARSSVMLQEDSLSQSVGEPVDLDVRNANERKDLKPKTGAKSKLLIQKELLGLKKRALALRREGKLEEAEEELKKGRFLEKQLEEMDIAPKVINTSVSDKQVDTIMVTDVGDEGEVTDQDMNDPTYLSVLENLGWKDDNNENMPLTSSREDEGAASHVNDFAVSQSTTSIQGSISRKSKGEIRRELLGLKRKALALRRQGEAEEAEETLKMAKVLEAQLAEFEALLPKDVPAEPNEHRGDDSLKSSTESASLSFQLDPEHSPIEDLGNTSLVMRERPEEIVGVIEKSNIYDSSTSQANVSQDDGNFLQQDIMTHKRRAIALKREGKLAEAKEELRQAKLLEKRLQENNSQPSTSSTDLSGSDVISASKKESSPNSGPKTLSGSDVSFVGKKESSPNSGPKALSGRDRFKLQQESLSHKRKALKLRREGRTEEADAEFELAKALESQLEDSMKSPEKAAEPIDEVTVEDFLDPQLLSALKAVGLEDGTQSPEILESKNPAAAKIDGNISEERMQLEEQIKAEKIKALNFKRSGKQAEALDALRRAKLFEKKLNSLTP